MGLDIKPKGIKHDWKWDVLYRLLVFLKYIQGVIEIQIHQKEEDT